MYYGVLTQSKNKKPKKQPLLGNSAERNNRGIVTKRVVTLTAVAMEKLSKHVSVETNTRNNRRAMFYVRSMPRGYKKEKEDRVSQ
jgi:hypothetical protein